MIGWLIAMGIFAAIIAVMARTYIVKCSPDAAVAAVGKGAVILLIGLAFLEMTAAEMIAFDRGWREILEDAEFLYYILRFGGWACIAWGVSQFVFAVVLKVDEMGVECAKRLEK